jgi:hypothetical protein
MRAPTYVISFTCDQSHLFEALNRGRGRVVTINTGPHTWRLFCKSLSATRVGVWTSLPASDAKAAMSAFAASSMVDAAASTFSLSMGADTELALMV